MTGTTRDTAGDASRGAAGGAAGDACSVVSSWRPWSGDGGHYLELKGANLVATDAVRETKLTLGMAIDAKAMACVYGAAGVGKTLTIGHGLGSRLSVETLHIQFRNHPTRRDIRVSLFRALGFTGEPPKHPLEFDLLLKQALSRRFRVLVCDEAQWMSHECFELWRHLWDARETDFALIFSGGGDCYRVLRKHPMLASRIFLWQEFPALTGDEVLTVIPAFHPLWAEVDHQLISYANQRCAHGNFRAWARLTKLLQAALAMTGGSGVDRNVLHWAFDRLDVPP